MPKKREERPKGPGQLEEEGQTWVVTTIRVTQAEWRWLRRLALDRALKRGGGRADASEIIRELVDRAMRKGR
jgi:hypothetical protein